MKVRKAARTRRLGFEGLEQRSMLATVSFSGGILIITGDNTAETVNVTDTTPGTVTVTGTGIAAPFTRSGVVGIVANMQGGADTLNIGTGGNPVDLQGAVNILLGNDNDIANLFINTPAAVTVDGGFQTGAVAQNDIVNVSNSTIGSLAVTTYAGNDNLNIWNSNFVGLAANLGVASLTPGQVDADGFLMNGGSAVGAGINVGTAQAGGANGVNIAGATFTSLGINGGEGVDLIALNVLTVNGALAVNTFGGNDTVFVNTVVATSAISITTGAGTDTVTLLTVVTPTAVLDGGAGLGDTLNDDLSPAIGTRIKSGWENDDPLF